VHERHIRRFLKRTGVTFPIATEFTAFGPLVPETKSVNLQRQNGVFSGGDITPFEVHRSENITPFPFHLLVGADGTILHAGKTFDLPKLQALIEANLGTK
jgi:hypothetical protein